MEASCMIDNQLRLLTQENFYSTPSFESQFLTLLIIHAYDIPSNYIVKQFWKMTAFLFIEHINEICFNSCLQPKPR